MKQTLVEAMLVVGFLAILFGGLQGISGRTTFSKTRFGLPTSRRTGWIAAAIGGALLLAAGVIKWLSS